MERRQTPRVKVQFRSSFSAPQTVEGDGMVVDLSHVARRPSSHDREILHCPLVTGP